MKVKTHRTRSTLSNRKAHGKNKETNKSPYKSKFESFFAGLLASAQIKIDYESDKFEYTLKHKYNPDWKAEKVTGGYVFFETKGLLDAQTRQKMKAVKEQNPDLDIRFVFQKAGNVIRKGSKITYGMWAEKNGFKWCEQHLPQEWLNEIKKER